ncbi:cytochrome c oxidase subunit I [Candidatus Methylacidithermus pantelleriae]|uniref:Cytochrome c oxidase subunit 1 n=1 Tax=Candidatus Methylacidithermus pantelleriae TaxID=2744239 RepID=A0A8J2BLU1_9BACT|nr:cbb3-type cytochrome c oxidase subunit I [Candidatus Methylacidithermus pantelleriae]CAF0700466.1 Cytochrome c oxidase subunit 1 [Candidatus Methylacidithermus pantelleriae]
MDSAHHAAGASSGEGVLHVEESWEELEHHYRQLPWWRRWVFSTDHKVIGLQYTVTALLFLFIGFSLMMVMRWQLAHPGQPVPWVGPILEKLLGPTMAPGGVITPQLYNTFGAMHGTIMIFLGVVPLGFAGIGNFVVPLQVGAPDMAFPRINMASFWAQFVGGLIMLASFFVPGGAAKTGWTAYTPLADVVDNGPGFHPILNGQTLWIIGMIFVITASLLGSINFLATIIQLRAPGMTWMRLPFFVWAELVTAFLLLLAFPPLEAAAIMQFMDRVFGTSFFAPTGLVVNGQLAPVSGGGTPILWQHLFWFLAHPEVYVLVLPALGIVAEVIANNIRKPLYGYKIMVYSVCAIGFLSMIVWAHHMYMTGMGPAVSAFFQTTTVSISVPSVLIISCLVLSLWGASIRFTLPMLWALAFIPMFGIGGLTGLPLAFSAAGLVLHDTYYVIGHFHYLVAPGSLFAAFAAVYYWFPKATGRYLNEFLGKIHFWGSLIFMNGIFWPMLIQGFAGIHRRWYDGGASWQLAQGVLQLNYVMSVSTWLLGIFQLFFIVNFFWSLWFGRKVESDNPWEATTLEWATPTPPPHGNFQRQPLVYRGPYEYGVPGYSQDYLPQFEAFGAPAPRLASPAPPAGA